MANYPYGTKRNGAARRREVGQTVDINRLYAMLEALDLLKDNSTAKQALNEARAARELVQMLSDNSTIKQAINEARAAREDLDATHIR